MPVSNINIRKFGKGDDQPTAAELNQIGDAARGLLRPGMAGNLQGTRSRAGLLMTSNPTLPILATLSGSASPYSWTEVAGTRSGTSTAYEVNGVAGLAGKKRVLFAGPGVMYFQDIREGTTAPGIPDPWLCGCGGTMPTSIPVTPSITGPFGGYTACFGGPGVVYMPTTLTWQPVEATPPGGAPIPTTVPIGALGSGDTLTVSAGGYCYLSPIGMWEPHRKYILGCYRHNNTGGTPSYNYCLFFWNGPTQPSGFSMTASIYTWDSAGVGENTCTPFHFKSGTTGYAACAPTSGNRLFVQLG
jgi:hypothetical protein